MTDFSFSSQSLSDGETRSLLVPLGAAKLLSPTSEAITCFTQQQFSDRLQAYLINYVLSVNGSYSVYA